MCVSRKSLEEKQRNKEKRKDLFSLNKKEFCKTPISYISKKLYEICGYYQFIVFGIVLVLFIAFVAFVIYKNFFGKTSIYILLCDKAYNIGYIDSDCFSKFVLSLVEIATLPFLILTLMFSTNSSFQNSEREKTIDKKLFEVLNGVKQTQLACWKMMDIEEVVTPSNINSVGKEAINDDKIGEVKSDK